MMTVSGWQSSTQAENYYGKDNYFIQGSSLGKYYGSSKLLEHLGMKNGQEINSYKGKKLYKQLLDGINPKTGETLFRKPKKIKNSSYDIKFTSGKPASFTKSSALKKETITIPILKKNERRSGFDVTFSAPKSVSLLYEFGSPKMKRVMEKAHHNATQKAMKAVMRKILTRVRDNSKGAKKTQQKVVDAEVMYAQFKHDVSRRNKAGYIDPNLHTHNFIFNIAMPEGFTTEQKKLYALYVDELFSSKRGTNTHTTNLLGREYRIALAQSIENMGLDMELTDEKHGFFEVAGVRREDIISFSGRKEDLEKAIKEEIAAGKVKEKDKYRATKEYSASHKGKKESVDRDEIKAINIKRLEEYTGKTPEEWVKNVLKNNKKCRRKRRKGLLESARSKVQEYIYKAGITLTREEKRTLLSISNNKLFQKKIPKDITVLEEIVRDSLAEIRIERIAEVVRKTVESIEAEASIFNAGQILERAMKLGAKDKITSNEIKPFVVKMIKAGEIVSFKLENNKMAYATKKMYDAETAVFAMTLKGKDTLKPLVDAVNREKIRKFQESHPLYSGLNEGQVAMANFIMQSRDRYLGILGDAGTGKTFTMSFYHDAIKLINPELAKKIIGISFTGKAAAGLEADSGIKSTTLDSFLMSEKHRKKGSKKEEGGRVIIVDEATMVGSLKMQELYEVAEKNNDRIVLIGDPKQFAAVSGGSLFKDLLDSNTINKIALTETMRQKDAGIKKIVTDMKQQRWGAAVSGLKKRKQLYELTDTQAIIKSSQIYIDAINNKNMGDKIVDRSLIISSTNIVRNATNKFIRGELKRLEILPNKGKVFNTLSPVNIAGIKQYMSSGIEEAKPDIVIPQPGVPTVIKNETYTFVGKSKDSRNIIIRDTAGKEVAIDIEKYGSKLGYFKKEKKEFAVDDIIVLTKNHKEYGFKNGMRGQIEHISKEGIITFLADDKTYKIDTDKYKYFDYGYAVTDYKSQGSTTGHVIALVHPQMATQNSFYTQITRCKFEATLITSDLKKFTQNAHKSGVAESTVGKERLNKIEAAAKVWQSEKDKINEVNKTKMQEKSANEGKIIKSVLGELEITCEPDKISSIISNERYNGV